MSIHMYRYIPLRACNQGRNEKKESWRGAEREAGVGEAVELYTAALGVLRYAGLLDCRPINAPAGLGCCGSATASF